MDQWIVSELENKQEELLTSLQKVRDFINLTPEIYRFLVEDWGWSEAIAILISIPLAFLCIIVPIIISVIVTNIIGKIILNKINEIFF